MPSPKMPSPKRNTAVALIAMLTLSTAATTAHAADDDETPPDARLEGYQREAGAKGPLALPASGTTTTWFLAVLLGGLCFGVMSKNGKRSHLD